LAWLVAGAANAIGTVAYESLLQERTPDAFRGRVFAATEAVLDISYLAGAGAAALLSRMVGVPISLGLAGLVLIGASIASRRLIRSPEVPQEMARPPAREPATAP